MGNVVNRVFDSAGPEGRVRGTPQQIIEKYQTLARDAQLAGDRVAAENFLQHSEHYSRLLGEAQRQQQENQRRDPSAQPQPEFSNGHDRTAGQERQGDDQPAQSGNGAAPTPAREGAAGGLETIEPTEPTGDTGLVSTPESASGLNGRSSGSRPSSSRSRKKPAAEASEETASDGAAEDDGEPVAT